METRSNKEFDELCAITTTLVPQYGARPAAFKAACAQRPDLAAAAVDPTGQRVMAAAPVAATPQPAAPAPVVVAVPVPVVAPQPGAAVPEQPETFEAALTAAEGSEVVHIAKQRAAAGKAGAVPTDDPLQRAVARLTGKENSCSKI